MPLFGQQSPPTGVTQTQLDATLASIQASMVQLSDAMPAAETITPAAGVTNGKATREGHTHPRLSNSQRVTLGADGTAAVTYTKPFDTAPGVVPTAINASGRLVHVEVVSDTIINGKYVGCVIKGSRAQLLPALTSIVLIGPLISALGNFDIFGGSAAGVVISIVSIQASS